jgi:alpha-D-ribose 1-methylphosphonate 5-triphosphate synthase subunit PhnH
MSAGIFDRLGPGFSDPVHDAQACFRLVLDAMAHPGRIVELQRPLGGPAPAPLGMAATATALCLCDHDTPVWLDAGAQAAAHYLAFHCGSRVTPTPGEASFAFASNPDATPPLDQFMLGTDEYPERSTTLVVEAGGLSGVNGVRLSGPGICDTWSLSVAGLPARFWTERLMLAELAPRGIDVLFSCGDRLVALPRSTRVEVQGAPCTLP